MEVSVYLSIHLLKGILVASKVWKLWMNLLLTSLCKFSCWHKFSTPSGKYQGAQLLSMFSFLRNYQTAKLSSKVAISFCISTSNVWEFLLLHILTSVWCCQCSDLGHSNRQYLTISFFFSFPFPWWHVLWNILSYLYFPFVDLLWWGVCLDLWDIVFIFLWLHL